jgi:DNA-binding NarL/FixJ family response regulator
VINVIVIDDHPAVRAGLVALLRQEPGFIPAATAAGIAEARELLTTRRFDVALADYQLADGTGAELCLELNAEPPFLVYTAFFDDAVERAAQAAGASGVVPKAAPAEELFDALRTIAKGGRVFGRRIAVPLTGSPETPAG